MITYYCLVFYQLAVVSILTHCTSYLNIPFDLSQVLFIATANSMSTIPAPLLDRMELIYIPGYTQEEKAQIAVRHLIPKQLQEHGLTNQHLHIPEDSVRVISKRFCNTYLYAARF